MASTLGDFFGTDRIAFSERSMNANTARSFTSFSAAVQVVDARVWSGIHFRTARRRRHPDRRPGSAASMARHTIAAGSCGKYRVPVLGRRVAPRLWT